MPIDPSQIDPDAIYVVDEGSGAWPTTEIDLESGQVVEFAAIGEVEVREETKLTGRQLLGRLEAAERTIATGRLQATPLEYVKDTDLFVEDDELVERDDVTPKENDDQ